MLKEHVAYSSAIGKDISAGTLSLGPKQLRKFKKGLGIMIDRGVVCS